jgi:carboxymethylenebutenolidase
VNFYGVHPAVKPNFANLQCPVLGIFGGKDHITPPAAVEALRAQLEAAGKPIEFHTYPEAQHAFFNDARPEVYDAQAAADAWSRVLAFFRTHLG